MKPKSTRKAPQLGDVKDAPSEALVRLRAGDAALAMALLRKGGPISPELGAELAELLAKTIKRPRGRPKASIEEARIKAARTTLVRIFFEAVRSNGSKAIDAITLIAERYAVSESRVNRLLYPTGDVAQLAREMDARDCYLLLPEVREFLNRRIAAEHPELLKS